MDYYKELLEQIAKLYFEYVKKGVFYDFHIKTENGKNYYYIHGVNELKEEPNKTVDEWLEELTGKIGIGSSLPEIFRDIANEMAEEYLTKEAKEENETDQLDDETIQEIDEQKYELVDSIGRLRISELKKYYQQ